MNKSLHFTDPTYLRSIRDGLLSGAVHKENASALPLGLVVMYEEALPHASNVNERKKFLEFFAVWALLKKEVSAAFVVPLLVGWTEEQVMDYIAQYSKWFNSPVSCKYVLYHERLRIFLLFKCSQRLLHEVNNCIIDFLSQAKSLEAVSYQYEFAVYHYLFQNEGGELVFLTNTNTFIEAKRTITDIKYFHGLFEIVLSKYATLGLINEVGLLMRSFKQYLEIGLESGFFDSSRLTDDSYVRSFINELKILPINRRKVFWFNLIVDLTFNKDINIDQLNLFLAIYDSEEDDIISTYKNRNENVYSFSDYDIRFDKYQGVSKGQIYLLINELIQKGVCLSWLLNRFFWLASFSESRDGFISDKLTYQQDFFQIDFCNRDIVLQKLRETAIFNGAIDMYRGSHFNQQFVVILSETPNNLSKLDIQNKPFLFLSREDAINACLAEFSFSTNYFSLSASELAPLINQDQQLYYLSDKEAIDKLNDLILFIKMNENFEIQYFEDLFTDFLCDYCGGTLEDCLWLHEESLDCTYEMIRFITLALSPIEVKRLFEYLSQSLEFGIWNEYIGMSEPMRKSDAFSFWKNALLPLFCSDSEFTNRLVELAEIDFFSKAEIIQCFCDIHTEVNSDLLSILGVDLEYIINEFKNDSLLFFKILKKINVLEEIIFLHSTNNNTLDLKLTILLLAHGFSNEMLIENLISGIKKGPSDLELRMLKFHLLSIYSNLSDSEKLTSNIEYLILGVIRMAPIKISIQSFFEKAFNKTMFLFVFRNDIRYINDLTSKLDLN